MINQIRADFYRQLHTVGMYLMLAVTIIYALWAVLTKSVGGVSVSVGSGIFTKIADQSWTVLFGLKAANMTATLLLYFFIGVFVIVFGYEFTQKVYKNTLISGISRLQFILAKYLVMLLDLLILFTTHFAMVLIGGLIKGRALGGDWTTVFETMGLSIVAATFFLSVVFSLGVFLLIATGSMTIATIVVVIFPLLIEVLNVIAQWKWLKYFDFFGVSQSIGVGAMKMSALSPYIATSFGFLIVMIGLSVLILRRKEL